MSQHSDRLKVGAVIEGVSLAEPIRIIFIQGMNSHRKIGGKGLRTGNFHELVLSIEQLNKLRISSIEESFDGDADRFRLGIEAHRIGLAYEYDPYFSLSIARVDPLPHQLEAVYEYMLPLPRIRFLLADDAGAGKTIMAGLLLRELKIRGLVQRALIVTPASLSFQWKRELLDRFRENFTIIRGQDLRDAYGTNPWQESNQIITSMDWAKRDDVMTSLRRSYWDLIIVDEAHKMSAADSEHKSDRYLLGEVLSAQADHYVLLTATPHKGDPNNFCLFLQLLDKDVYGDIKSLEDAMRRNYAPFYLRRIKEAMVTFPDNLTGEVKKIFTNREVITVHFDLDIEESKFYLDLTSYVENQSIMAAEDQTPRGRAIGFTMAMYQRRFASSIYAVRRSLERREQKLKGHLKMHEAFTFNEKVWEELGDLPEDEAEYEIDKIEDVSLSRDAESNRQEIEELRNLISKAKHLEQREIESKLKKLFKILTEQNIFKDKRTKLLIFTEHRDTLGYLAGRKEGNRWIKGKLEEWGLRVTQIHGQMKIGNRDTPGTRLFAEQEFKDPDGAQILVATEAAGEGINLQFCWMMINYDIPWNPMRLEQRMGRIHRYGQERDCIIFNFVALNTREGQVLDRLLERLKEIRNELGTDKVFDVVGEVFPANQLEKLMRELYARKITIETVMNRVVRNVDAEWFRKITESTLEGLAIKELNLPVIMGKKELAKERRLVPEIVQQFFVQVSRLVGLTQIQHKNGMIKVGKLPRSIISIGESIEKVFGPLSKEYKWVTFDKKFLTDDPTIEWVTPGHPLFESVRRRALNQVTVDLEKGSVFYDLRRETAAILDVFAASVKDGRAKILHSKLFVVETLIDGQPRIRQPTVFLDLTPATNGTHPDLTDALRDKEKIELFLYQNALIPFLDEVRSDTIKEIVRIKRHIELSLNEMIHRQNLILANLIERQQNGEELSGQISKTSSRIEELNSRLEQRQLELLREEELTIGDITHLGRAWVLPHPERTGFESIVSNAEVEKIAMERVMGYERDRGWDPEDVSSEDRGFDILSKDPLTGAVRFIEVKGRAGVGSIIVSKNEYDTSMRLKQDYWLYVVFDCISAPKVVLVQDPSTLAWNPMYSIEHFIIDPKAISSKGLESSNA